LVNGSNVSTSLRRTKLTDDGVVPSPADSSEPSLPHAAASVRAPKEVTSASARPVLRNVMGGIVNLLSWGSARGWEVEDRTGGHLAGAQSRLGDALGRRHRELVDEREVARDLEAGEFAACVLDDRGRCLLVRGGAGHETDHVLDLLAPELIGDGDHGAGQAGRMAIQHSLDLGAGDVLPAPAHHVLEPPDEAVAPLGVATGQVTGVQ